MLSKADKIKYKNKYRLWKIMHPGVMYVCDFCKHCVKKDRASISTNISGSTVKTYGSWNKFLSTSVKTCPAKVLRMNRKTGDVFFMKKPKNPSKTFCIEFLRCEE